MKPDFAGMLSLLRRETGISQKQAASELGISQALLSHYENGVREPKLEFVVHACDYYGVSADYILGRVNEKSRELESEQARRCCDSVRATFGLTEQSEELTREAARYLSVAIERVVGILRDPEDGTAPVDDAVMKVAEAQLIKTAFETKSRFMCSDDNLRANFPTEYKAYRETLSEAALMRAELTKAITKGQQ
jgi:transcriptional regulator with XRE-family HTH domain